MREDPWTAKAAHYDPLHYRRTHAKGWGMTDPGAGQGGPRSISISGFEAPVEIGRGGFGVVYKAHQVGFERTVALKILPIAAADESAA